jgi:exodeoxyribonuclease V alpha subunit
MSLLLERMRTAVDEGRLRPLQLALADWCLRHGGSEPVALAMALTVGAVHDGHSCWRLPAHGAGLPGDATVYGTDRLLDALRQSDLVGTPGMALPLILDGHRLYLHRYHDYEVRLAAHVRRLTAHVPDAVDVAPLLAGGGVFDYDWVVPGQSHWQAVAAYVALRHRLVVISGGPGTGKTYAVLRLIRLMIEAARARSAAPPIVRLAAPTGKAAARMVASTQQGLAVMRLDAAVTAHVPQQASTLHRLLGMHRSSTRPRHDAANPLLLDVLIVDEASMIDLPMMTKLVEALPQHARLVLLGDRYQLASVESGSVLAEMCDAAGVNTFSAGQFAAGGPLFASRQPEHGRKDPGGPLRDHVVTLRTSHRFSPESTIGRIAAAVNVGDLPAVLDAIASGPDAAMLDDRAGDARLRAVMADAAERAAPLFMRGLTPGDALAALERHRVLTATRVGPTGSDALNRAITDELARRHGFDAEQRWYHGRVVLVTENDYRVRLFNGDTGIAMADADGGLRVWFMVDGTARAFLPSALPAHGSAWAITVHKSQGSEFDRVTLVLPDEDSPVLTRELVYTGITRARREVLICSSVEVLGVAITRRTQRESALASRLS